MRLRSRDRSCDHDITNCFWLYDENKVLIDGN